MRRLVRVKEKVLGFDFSLGGGLVVGFDVGFDVAFDVSFAGFAGSFIAGLLSALECAGCGRGACWCPIVMKWRCYLKTGLEGPRRRSQSPERELAMNLAKSWYSGDGCSAGLQPSAPAKQLCTLLLRMRPQCWPPQPPERADSSVRFATG